MSKHFFAMAFAIGLAIVAWVGAGFAGASWLALAVTAVIGAVYLLGAFELRQFRAATGALAHAVAGVPQPLPVLADWLERVPASLRNPVRLRIEEQRGALPGPALTPYLVGLLVMLGMLGTFLGMVLTFKGAVFALQGSADLQAMRSALAEPIKGLGLSFGTSVAGVAASAMLGLMSAISRRERLEVARQLDHRIATDLRPLSLAHQRQETFRVLEAQAGALPQLAGQLEAMMERIELRSRQLDEQLLARQGRFHQDAAQAYTGLARAVGASLQESLAAGARAAGESITPVVASAMAQVVQESQRLHAGLGEVARAQVDALSAQFGATQERQLQAWTQLLARSEDLVRSRIDGEAQWVEQHGARMDRLTEHWRAQLEALRQDEQLRGAAAVARLGELQAAVAQHLATLGAALEAPIARLLHTASEVPQAAAGVIAQLREEMSGLAARDNLALQERSALLEQLASLLQVVNQAAGEQRTAIEALVASASGVMDHAASRFAQVLERHAGQAGDAAAHVAASSIELASVGEAFGQGMQLFQSASDKVIETLQGLEASLARSTARSDEQLAYYVAQAREVIDLSIASQQGLVEHLRQPPGAAPALAGGARG